MTTNTHSLSGPVRFVTAFLLAFCAMAVGITMAQQRSPEATFLAGPCAPWYDVFGQPHPWHPPLVCRSPYI